MRVDLPLNKKTVENQDWATGPPSRRASEPPGLRAAGPSQAVGRGPAFSKTLSHLSSTLWSIISENEV